MEINYKFLIDTFYIVLAAVPTTLKLTIIPLLAAAPFALAIALIRLQKGKSLWKMPVSAYVTFVRGTPIVLQILMIYSLLPSLLNALMKAWSFDINVFDWDPIFYAYIVFTLNIIALLSEVLRSAFGSVEKGQLEAAECAGLTKVQAYIHILLPQAMVVAMPNLCNLTVNLIKGTSLAFLMTVKDMTAVAKVSASYGYNYIEAYLDVFVGYIIICSIAQVLFHFAEAHMGRYRLSKQK